MFCTISDLAVGRFSVNVVKNSDDSKNKGLIHPRFHHHIIQILAFHQFLHFLIHPNLCVNGPNTYLLLTTYYVIYSLQKKLKTWKIVYLGNYVAPNVNNAAIPIREITPDLKVPAFITSSSWLNGDSNCIVLDKTRIGLFQAENQGLWSFIVQAISFPLLVNAKGLNHASLKTSHKVNFMLQILSLHSKSISRVEVKLPRHSKLNLET